jgi:hypothetical protein
LEGDIVVTAVAHHFAICRMTADGVTQEFLESQRTRVDAEFQARALAGASHRVFVYPSAGVRDYFSLEHAEFSQRVTIPTSGIRTSSNRFQTAGIQTADSCDRSQRALRRPAASKTRNGRRRFGKKRRGSGRDE